VASTHAWGMKNISGTNNGKFLSGILPFFKIKQNYVITN
jgi:hypothetical protein